MFPEILRRVLGTFRIPYTVYQSICQGEEKLATPSYCSWFDRARKRGTEREGRIGGMGLSTHRKAYIARKNGAPLFRWKEGSIEPGQPEGKILVRIPSEKRRSPHPSEWAGLAFGPFAFPS